MADKKKPSPRYTTPVGVARYPHLNKPDEYQGVRKFKCDLILDREDAQAVIEKIEEALPAAEALRDEFVKAARAKGKKTKEQDRMLPYSELIDKDTGDETGQVVFKFSSNAEWKDAKGNVQARKIPFFSAKGEAVPDGTKPTLWGGSRIRLSYSVFPYHNAGANNYGVSLRIEAVKVIEAVSGSGGNAAGFGFDEAEEGWSAPKASEMGGDESGTATGSAADEDDF